MSKGAVIVTGGSRGIGRTVASLLWQSGFDVAICSRDSRAVESALKTIRLAHGGVNDAKLMGVVCDVSIVADVEKMVTKVIAECGYISVLVNNAAISIINDGKRSKITDISHENWLKTISINLTGVFNCCKAVAPHMIANKGGDIINISSALERTGRGIASVDYIASKGGVAALTKALAYELGEYGIRVNTVSPGRTQTEMVGNVKNNDGWARSHVPLARLAQPEDIAEAVHFLVSDKNKYISGANLDCNGAWVSH